MTTKPWIKLIHVKYITKFGNYLLSKNNTIVLEMNLLMRWIMRLLMFLRIIITNYMKEREFHIDSIPFCISVL